MNYEQLYNAIQSYAENTESLFVQNIPVFVQEAEERIYNSVQLPSLRKNVVGNVTVSNQYLTLPDDWLSTFSVAIIDASGNYTYLLNKDVNYIREAYPNKNALGKPLYYAVFGASSTSSGVSLDAYDRTAMSFILGPTPDQNYQTELHYFYYPVSIVQGVAATLTTTGGSGYNNGLYANVPLIYKNSGSGSGSGIYVDILVTGQVIQAFSTTGLTGSTLKNGGSFYSQNDVLVLPSTFAGGAGTVAATFTVASVNNPSGVSWLGDNYDPVLFYGAMREAMIFMKGEQDMVTYYEKMYQDALQQLNRLGTGLERGDAYRNGQARIMVKQ